VQVLRTPDERFADLPGHPFAPHHVEVDGLRMHYVDEGPRDAAPVLMLHGEPSWSYLYRKMIPIIAGAGHRAVAPDFVGFGRSDKLPRREDYTYRRHVDWTRGLIEALGLRDITLVGQDWGGLIGLRLVGEEPDRFARAVAANTGFLPGPFPMPEVWYRFREVIQTAPTIDVARSIQAGCATKLPPDVLAAYEAPFPDDSYKEAVRAFPGLVPVTEDDPAIPANRKAWEALSRWEKPFLTAFGDSDKITRGMDQVFQHVIPGAKGQPHTTIAGAGHFLQEDKGEELAGVIVAWLAR
jgi:haloalkane dehalogenase